MSMDTIIALSSLFWQILGTVFAGIALYITVRHGKNNRDK